MASSSSYSSGAYAAGSPPAQSGSPPVQAGPATDDQRKRKRMESNRESARRSRMRKQKHLDELAAQAARLMKENSQITMSLNVTRQNYLNVESENSVLRAQMMELSQRLESLNEILNYINGGAAGSCVVEAEEFVQHQGLGDGFLNNDPWNLVGSGNYQQPVMASSVEMFDYY